MKQCNGMETLKEGVTHPFNLFTFGFGFKRHYQRLVLEHLFRIHPPYAHSNELSN